MPSTKISDVIVPEVFNPYLINRSAELSALWAAGIVVNDGRVEIGSRSGGETINMPFWNDLTGDEEELSALKALTVSAITATQDVAVLQAIGKAWGANDLAGALAGADPMAAIGDLVATWWARVMQKRLLKTLEGVFAAASMSGNVHNISGLAGALAVIDKNSFADAMFKLGDASGGLTSVAMHSATLQKLYKDDLLDTAKGADGAAFATYQGKRIIVDDGLPVSGAVYTTYLFGPGAFGYAEGSPRVSTETDRDSLAGEDILINRRHFVLHPRGVKWVGSAVVSTGDVASGHPTRAELATGTNWTRVYDPKQIRVVAFRHKLA